MENSDIQKFELSGVTTYELNKFIIDLDVCCTKCKGTGLYKGIAEQGASAVICMRCNGTGKEHIHEEYERFVERKQRDDVKRVYKTAGGFGITDENTKTDSGDIIPFSEYGCSYNEWKRGIEPKPITKLHCPMMHFGQGTEDGNFIRINICEKVNKCFVGTYFPKCAETNRAECWKKYDVLVEERS